MILNDWSARDLQREETTVRLGPAKGKDFATSIGPWLVTPDELADRRSATGFDLAMTATVNGVETSRGTWSSIHFSFGQMLERASADVQLRPGDLLGQRDGWRWLPARDPRGDDRPLPRARRRGGAPDRGARGAPVAGGRTSRRRSMTERILPTGIDTPELVVDRDRLYANVLGLQRTLDERGIRLRPHAKTHKSVRIGRLQVEAGAAGLTVGTLGEAEVFALAGLRDIFVAYPVWAEGPKAERVRSLHGTADLRVGVDSAAGAERLGAAVKGMSQRLRVLVEIDPGLHRTGVGDPEAAVAVARAAKAAGLHVEGVFAHAGHSYTPGRAGAASLDEISTLEAAAEALEADGFEIETISAGSTPTRLLSGTGRVNEIRAGTYVLGDRQQVALGAMEPDETAAVVAATVVSSARDHFVLDAGAKALTKDRPDWLPGFGEVEGYPDVVIEKLSDYHGVTRVTPLAQRPQVGEVVTVVPNHICPVVDLVSSFTVVAPDGRTERWPVDARGRSG